MFVRNGFTLVEVIVVSALIMLASLVAFHTAEVVSQRDKEERMRYALLEMRAALDSFFQDSFQNPAIPELEKPRFPVTINELLTTKRPIPGGGFYLRRLPLNPMFAETRWLLVGNNDSDPEELKEITDSITSFDNPSLEIVDIRCPDGATPAVGTNGIEYKDW